MNRSGPKIDSFGTPNKIYKKPLKTEPGLVFYFLLTQVSIN